MTGDEMKAAATAAARRGYDYLRERFPKFRPNASTLVMRDACKCVLAQVARAEMAEHMRACDRCYYPPFLLCIRNLGLTFEDVIDLGFDAGDVDPDVYFTHLQAAWVALANEEQPS